MSDKIEIKSVAELKKATEDFWLERNLGNSHRSFKLKRGNDFYEARYDILHDQGMSDDELVKLSLLGISMHYDIKGAGCGFFNLDKDNLESV